MLYDQLHRKNDRWVHAFAFDPSLFREPVVIRSADAYIYMLFRLGRIRLDSLYTGHVSHVDGGITDRGDRNHDHTMDSLWFYSLDRYARMDIPCYGMHWILNRSNTPAFWSYHIHVRIRTGRPFCIDHATNACTRLCDRRVYAEKDTMHLAGIQSHPCCWKIDIQPLSILFGAMKMKNNINFLTYFAIVIIARRCTVCSLLESLGNQIGISKAGNSVLFVSFNWKQIKQQKERYMCHYIQSAT